jgi:hypothetical protein
MKLGNSGKQILIVASALIAIDSAQAVQFEPVGKALAALLGTTKPFTKKVQQGSKETTAYYTKNKSGMVDKIALIENGVYPPNCTHTWAIALDAQKAEVKSIRVIEMSCQHAFPTRSASFLNQYVGKGPAQLTKLEGDIHTIAKATGSSDLLTAAVKHSIQFVKTEQGKF